MTNALGNLMSPLDPDKYTFSLAAKVAIVTGASRGLGEAIARGFAAAGARLVLAARTGPAIEALSQEIQSNGGDAIAVPADLTRPDDCERVVQTAVDDLGGLDILVNNAGMPLKSGPSTDVTPDEWYGVLDANLSSTFFCCQAAGRRMISAGGGKIVNMSSMFGLVGYPGRSAYAAAKGAINQLTRVLALEWAEHGICVNAIAPTHIETDANRARIRDPDFRDEMLPQIPVGRYGIPEEVVGATIFLCSKAADLITGQVLAIDGGWTAR